MKKQSADVLAVQLAAEILRTDPNKLIYVHGEGSGEVNANTLAAFIRTLSAAFEKDLDNDLHATNFFLRPKS